MKKILKAMTSMLVAAMVLLVGGVVPVKAAEEKEVKVYVKNTPNWETVNVYSFNPELFGAWAGQAMTKDADGWYSIAVKTDAEQISFVINNGSGEQTVDVKDVATSSGKIWIVIGEKGEDSKYAAEAKTAAEAGFPGADAPAPAPSTGDKKDDTKKTGDATPILPIAAVGTVALLAFGATSLKKKAVR
ncbi:MAG: starch-binding protein [Clostridiales bacterium]|nr:starch-binding protein [Clostridiales bacterium]